MTPRLGPLCLQCRYLRADATCAAFPDGIPDLIAELGHDHTTPIEGDGGIQFESLPAGASQVVLEGLELEEAEPEIEEVVDAMLAYEERFGRPAPQPFGISDAHLLQLLRQAIATGNPELDAYGHLGDGVVA